MKQHLFSQFESLRSTYVVEDLVTSDTNFLFLLESPHTQELKYDFPVSGSSGATMTKELFGEENILPLGRFLGEYQQTKIGPDSLKHIGIMNVSPIPMQKSAYHPIIVEENEDLLSAMEGIRSNNNSKRFKEETWNLTQEILVDDLTSRLKPYSSSVIIPCGKFAEKFVALVQKELPLEVVKGIPHPSYNSWSRPVNKPKINEIRKMLGIKKAGE